MMTPLENSVLEKSHLHQMAQGVQGWLSEKEGEALYAWANEGRQAVVEIGSWKGRSSVYLGQGVVDAGHPRNVFCVDHFTGSREHREMPEYAGKPIWTFPDFLANLVKTELLGTVIPLTMTSEQAAKDWFLPFDLLFIDGGHDPDVVRADVEAWEPLLSLGGRIALHDWGSEGVGYATAYLENSGRFEVALRKGTIWNAVKLA